MKLKNNEILLLIDVLAKLIHEDIYQKEQQDLVKHSILNAISENKTCGYGSTTGHSHCYEIGSDEEQPKSEKRRRGRPRKYVLN